MSPGCRGIHGLRGSQTRYPGLPMIIRCATMIVFNILEGSGRSLARGLHEFQNLRRNTRFIVVS